MVSALLRGDRVRLNAFSQDDLPRITRWYEDNEFARLWDATPAFPKSQAQLEKWLEEEQQKKDSFVFAIRLLDDAAAIGLLSIDGILWTHQTGWLGLGIGEAAQRGKGYGYEAMQLALRFAFDELNLRRVQLTVFSYNLPAMRLYEKLNFQREGAFREALHRDGERHDMYLYGLLRHEWRPK